MSSSFNSYTSLWFGTTQKGEGSQPQGTSPSIVVSVPSSAEENTLEDPTDSSVDQDIPPAFPSLDSIQRTRSPPRTKKLKNYDELMPPPAFVPSSRNTLQLPPSVTRPAVKREKVALEPGHSPLDWARLKSSGNDLRGVTNLTRITPSQLKMHNKMEDAWASFNGKVYNITPYLAFHPGGKKEIMRAAGRDGTKLFGLTHPWVNVEMMLDECLVGFLVPEP